MFFSLNISSGPFPGNNDKEIVKETLQICSNTEVTGTSGLYIGEGLDKDCLINEFNKVFKQDAHKNWFSGREHQTEINDYVPGQFGWWGIEYKNTPTIKNLKSVTSIWSDSCGERCRPGHDFLYEVEGRFWYLVRDTRADMSILKLDNEGNPLLIISKDYYSTLARNILIHLPKGKDFDLSSGGLSISEISLKEIKSESNGIKSYFKGGGAFWHDSETTFNFDNGTKTWKYINASGNPIYRGISCQKKELFLKRTGWGDKGFEHLMDEVCYHW